jgi:pimeloyl-ACP methyl ester carboxylesterase
MAHLPLGPRIRLRLLFAAASVGLFAFAAGPVAAADAGATVRPAPPGPRFYKPPKNLPRGHGTLIWTRKASGIVPLASASETDLVLYTSKTPQGTPDAVSGSVSIPNGKPPPGGWPVITWAHGTTGVADSCAPTRVRANTPVAPYVTYVNPELNAWLDAGYAVVRTDFQGLGTPGPHSYLIGEAEGRSTLDIVRAARQLDPSIGKRFLIAGHSQGGHAALFAANEAKGWVPDLKLRGTAAFAPASHLKQQVPLLKGLTSPNPLSALATIVVAGASTATPQVDPQKLLSNPTLALYPQIDKTCLPQLAESDSLGGLAPSTLLRKNANTQPLLKVLGQNNPAVTTPAPILLLQGEADTTVFPAFTNQLDTELTGLGDSVDYQTFPGVDHGGVVSAGEADALAFFEQRLPPG